MCIDGFFMKDASVILGKTFGNGSASYGVSLLQNGKVDLWKGVRDVRGLDGKKVRGGGNGLRDYYRGKWERVRESRNRALRKMQIEEGRVREMDKKASLEGAKWQRKQKI